MKLIQRILNEAKAGTLTVTPQVCRSIQVYVRNRQFRNPRAEIDKLCEALAEGEFQLSDEYLHESSERIYDLILNKMGEWRNTAETRKFGLRERAVFDDYRTLRLIGVFVGEVDTYFSASHPGHEPANDVYPLWRLISNKHGHVDFIFRPWQANFDKRETGFYFV